MALSPTEDAIVDGALADGPPDELLAELENVPVTRKDAATLRPRRWLNDEVVNYMVELILPHAQRNGVYVTNTHFATKLVARYEYAHVRNWMQQCGDVFALSKLLVPAHVRGNHWIVACVDFKRRTIGVHDSADGDHAGVCVALWRWLRDEYLATRRVPDLGVWRFVQHTTPQQQNGFDCGVFAIQTIKSIACESPLSFSQSDMARLRRVCVYEIVTGQLR